jgi:hypothetical protein
LFVEMVWIVSPNLLTFSIFWSVLSLARSIKLYEIAQQFYQLPITLPEFIFPILLSLIPTLWNHPSLCRIWV